MSVGEYIAALLASEKLGAPGHVPTSSFPPVEPCYAPTRLPWPAAISRALELRGINGLYSHQALATDHIRAGHSIVAATPTASGKSLIYNLPVLDRYLRDRDARALYLFPLKALAQDQLGAFNALVEGWPKEAAPLPPCMMATPPTIFAAKSGAIRPRCLSAIPRCCISAFCPTTNSGRNFWQA